VAAEYAVEGDDGPAAAAWGDLAERVQASPVSPPRLDPRLVGRLRSRPARAAALPLEPTRLGRSSPTNFDTPEFGILAVDREAARALADEVLGRLNGRLSLGFLGGGSELGELRTAARRAGRRVVERSLQRSPYAEISDDVEAQVRRRLGSKSFSELRRRRRRLEEREPVELEVADGRERLGPLLAEGYALEGSGWKEAAYVRSLSSIASASLSSQS
jgi:hypothetical protein